MTENRPDVAVSRHRADVPYDHEQDPWIAEFDPIPGARFVFAVGVFVALLVGLVCTAVGVAVDDPGVMFTGLGLLAAAGVGMRILWVGGEE